MNRDAYDNRFRKEHMEERIIDRKITHITPQKTTEVYVAVIPSEVEYEPVLPKERQQQLDAAQNESVRAQRYTVWNTLLAGLLHSRGLDAEAAKLTKDHNGKWTSAVCGISLSHCKTAVAAAISDGAVGVDLESACDPRFSDALFHRITSEPERNAKLPQEIRIPVVWTRKEAAFKRRTEQDRSALSENALDETIRTVRIRMDRDYILSVACEPDSDLRIFEIDGERIMQRTDFETITV